MKKSTAVLLALNALLAGVLTGFILSPVKHGITLGDNNGIGNNNRIRKKNVDDCCDDDEDDDDEDDDEENVKKEKNTD